MPEKSITPTAVVRKPASGMNFQHQLDRASIRVKPTGLRSGRAQSSGISICAYRWVHVLVYVQGQRLLLPASASHRFLPLPQLWSWSIAPRSRQIRPGHEKILLNEPPGKRSVPEFEADRSQRLLDAINRVADSSTSCEQDMTSLRRAFC